MHAIGSSGTGASTAAVQGCCSSHHHHHQQQTTPRAAKGSASQHYERVAAAYEDAFFYSSQHYQSFVLGNVCQEMQLPSPTSEDQQQQVMIVDLGGGSGNFSQALAQAANQKVLCVDSSPEMLAQAVRHPGITPLLMDAFAFAQLPPTDMHYRHVLLKEVIHHIPTAQLPGLFQGISRQLLPGGSALIITRPQQADYPMFQRAKEIWAQQQPHHSTYTDAMEAAGLAVSVVPADYPVTLGLDDWLDMMRGRFWSTFSLCSDQELQQGIAEVAQQLAGKHQVQFVDRLLLLVGRKTAARKAAAPRQAAAAALV